MQSVDIKITRSVTSDDDGCSARKSDNCFRSECWFVWFGGYLSEWVEHIILRKIPEFHSSIFRNTCKQCRAVWTPFHIKHFVLQVERLIYLIFERKTNGMGIITWKVLRGYSSLRFQRRQLQSAEQLRKMSDQNGLNLTRYTGPVCPKYDSRY